MRSSRGGQSRCGVGCSRQVGEASGCGLRGLAVRVGWEVDGCEGVGAAEADGGVVGVVAYVGDVAPAAFALGACGALPGREGCHVYVAVGDDGVWTISTWETLKSSGRTLLRIARRAGLSVRRACLSQSTRSASRALPIVFVGASLFETLQDFVAEREELLPVCFELADAAGDDVGHVGEEGEVDAGFAAFDVGEERPDFVGGEAEDGGDEAGEGFGDAPEGGLGAAAGGVRWGRRCRGGL